MAERKWDYKYSMDICPVSLSMNSLRVELVYSFWNFIVYNQFSCSVMSNSLLPHGLQHARLSCPSPAPGASSNSCPSSWWCHPTISSSVIPFSSCIQSFPGSLCIRWPKYWRFSFSISPSSEYSGLIFLEDWLIWSPCCPRDSQESSSTKQFKSINSSAPSLLYGPTLTSIHDYWKSHSFD